MKLDNHHLPDFIIGGAQKCATTSLHHLLSGHDAIFIPPRELFFFDIDDINQHPDFFVYWERKRQWSFFDYERDFERYLTWYAEFFQDARADQIIGEHSTTYLASNNAAHRIADLQPDTQLIFLIRDPVVRAYSHYWHLVQTRRTVYTFEHTLQYAPENILQRGLYQQQLQTYFDLFPRENIRVILFEQFIKDMQSTVDELCRFLGVTAHLDVKSLPRWSNKTVYPRSLKLQLMYNQLVRNFGNKRWFMRARLPVMDNADKQTIGRSRVQLSNVLIQIDRIFRQLNAGKRISMTPATYEMLKRYYRKENAQLTELLDMDLSAYWKSWQD